MNIQKQLARKNGQICCGCASRYKILKKKSGRGSSRFQFFNIMDEILGENPTNASPHSLDVSNINQGHLEGTPNVSDNEEANTSSTPSRKKRARVNPRAEYCSIKKLFYENKEKSLKARNIEKKDNLK